MQFIIHNKAQWVAYDWEDYCGGYPKVTKWTYSFGNKKAEGDMHQCDLLGSKGANLAEMSNLGLPVPAGFTITTKVCNWYYTHDYTYPDGLIEDVDRALNQISVLTGRCFGDSKNPLFISVRSGAQASMPGMMDTILNLGLNDETVKALAKQANARFAYDSYRRFIEMYSNVVFKIDSSIFEDLLDDAKAAKNYQVDTQMQAADWQALIEQYKEVIAQELGKDFPQDPQKQLWSAIGGVFSSWMNTRAVLYRQLHSIPEEWGTAVTIQAMVFGNMGEDCATGVAFTRNPSTGVNELYGEFLINAQGEDVVSGMRTPYSITKRARIASKSDKHSLEELMPMVFANLVNIAHRLELHYRDIQDIEFTIERGKLWILQTRPGKCTVSAALKIAAEMAQEGMITKEEAILKIDPAGLEQIVRPKINPNVPRKILTTGLPASPGTVTGEIVFSSKDAEIAVAKGHKVILVRMETSPQDIHGMKVAEAVLTARGGMTSHAAVIARAMGKPCVCGVSSLKIDYKANKMCIGTMELKKGDMITLDGASGQIFLGRVAVIEPHLLDDFTDIMQWADEIRRMQIRATIETPRDARAAFSFGAQGIGLCRTEPMFFAGKYSALMYQIVFADNQEQRSLAFSQLLSGQLSYFIDLFNITVGRPIAIRLLDKLLNEFLPKTTEEIAKVAALMGVKEKQLAERIYALHEGNPIIGLQGCSLDVSYLDIVTIQVSAIFEAALIVEKQTNNKVALEIMVPFVGAITEFDLVKKQIDDIATIIMQKQNKQLSYKIGAVIAVPSAALLVKDIAQSADFVSFVCNEVIHPPYDIGDFMAVAQEYRHTARGHMQLGFCGQLADELLSIALFEKMGLDYVSCAPFHVPIARLAAAQAVLKLREI